MGLVIDTLKVKIFERRMAENIAQERGAKMHLFPDVTQPGLLLKSNSVIN